MTSRRGFTLIELVVGLVVSLLIGGLVHRLLLGAQRLARAQAERLALQENVRSAALVLTADLAGIGYDEVSLEASAALGYPPEVRSDLLAMEPGAITYLASRGGGVVCRADPGPPAEVVVEQDSWSSLRAPRDTDSLLVFAESGQSSAADDAWLHLGVAGVAGGSCPSGMPGMAFRVGAPLSVPLSGALLKVVPGAPARLVEVMQARHYQSGGRSWLGMRSVTTGEAITPVAGPLADNTGSVRGLAFTYRDAADHPTSTPTAVRAMEIELLGVTDQPVYRRDLRRAVVDSFALTARVALRNAARP